MDPKINWKRLRTAAAELVKAATDEDTESARAAVKAINGLVTPPKPMTAEDSKALAEMNRQLRTTGRDRRVL